MTVGQANFNQALGREVVGNPARLRAELSATGVYHGKRIRIEAASTIEEAVSCFT